jgi:hypothetical protein
MAGSIVQASSPNLISQPSVDFRRDDFDATIWNKGYNVIWEKAIECPCRGTTNHILTDCQNCQGSGWFFINPKRTKAVVTSINKITKFQNWSKELAGTVSVTTMSDTPLGYMDRLTLLNNELYQSTSRFSEVKRVRGTSNSYIFLSFKPITISSVYVFSVVDEPLILLESDDYEISETNPYLVNFSYKFEVGWNSVVSITYNHEVQYHVLDIVHDVRRSIKVDRFGHEEQVPLPYSAIARKASFTYEKLDKDGTGLIDNSY